MRTRLSLILTAALGLPAVLVPSSTVGLAGAAPAPSTPVLGLSPAIAGDALAAVAWAAHTAAGNIRVQAAVPVSSDPRQVGPAGRGDDGAPTLGDLGNNRFLLAAARGAFGRSELWWSTGDEVGWSPPQTISSPWTHNHHPQLATSEDKAWMVWVASNPGESRETLLAARWAHGAWGPVETIPGAPGTPMAPGIALHRGRLPAVVWAASDGSDAEIWISRRSNGGWSAPEALSHNDVPDIEPTLAFTAAGAVVSWARFEADGYRPVWRGGNARATRWKRARMLDSRPGSSPVILQGPSGPHVAWASVEIDTGQSVVRAAPVAGRRLGEVRRLARVPNARMAASGSLLTWSAATGPGAARLVAGAAERVALRPLSGDPWAPVSLRIEPFLPGTYRAFGDSITDGVVVTNGEITFTDGYPVPLGLLLSTLLNREILVANDGRAGEETPEGLERLAGLVMTNPRLFNLLMEGTNDVSELTDVDTIVTNLRAMVRRVQSGGGIAVLGTLLPRVNEGDDGVRNAHTDLVNAAMVTMAAEEGAMLVDQNLAFTGHPELFSDRLHPTPAGYDRMAGVWFRALQPLLTHLLNQQDTQEDLARARLLEPGPGQRRIQ